MAPQAQTPGSGQPQAPRPNGSDTRVIPAGNSRNGGAPMSVDDAGEAIARLSDPARRTPRKPKAEPSAAPADQDLEAAARHLAGESDTSDAEDDGHSEDESDDLAHQRDDDAPIEDDEPGDPTDDADPRETDDDDEPEFLNRKVKVKADGKEIEVTVAELTKGYQRRQDYSRKTEEVARRTSEVDSQLATVLQQRQALDAVLGHHAAAVQQAYGEEPDWDQLYESNPLEFVKQQAAWTKRGRDLQQLALLREQNYRAGMAQQSQMHAAATANEAKRMLERNPDWADPVKGKAARKAIEDYAKKALPPGTLDFPHLSSEHLEVIDKARKYDDLMDRVRKGTLSKPRAAENDEQPTRTTQPRAPRPATPGTAEARPAPRSERERKEFTQAKQRAIRTGKPEDAGEAIGMLLGRRRP